MNRERLLNLRQLLVEHHNNGIIFNLKHWGGITNNEATSGNMSDFKEQIDKNSCKTICCACGLHAIKRPQDGLQLIWKEYYGGEARVVKNIIDESIEMPESSISLEYLGHVGFNAANSFYELNNFDMTEELFGLRYFAFDGEFVMNISCDVTPLMVVEKLDYLLDGGNLEDNGCPYSYNYVWYQKRLIKEE